MNDLGTPQSSINLPADLIARWQKQEKNRQQQAHIILGYTYNFLQKFCFVIMDVPSISCSGWH